MGLVEALWDVLRRRPIIGKFILPKEIKRLRVGPKPKEVVRIRR